MKMGDKTKIKILQLNAAKRQITHDWLMAWLHGCIEMYIVCLQEPYITRKGLSRVPPAYEAFWRVDVGDKCSRACIIAPKKLHGYMVTQHSNKDWVAVRFKSLQVSIISIYMDINKSVREAMSGVIGEHSMGKKIIVCADTNAHHVRWGALGNRRTRIKSYSRGEQVIEHLDELDMCICNITPHMHTYIGDTGHSTHIDATFCSSALHDRIREWEVMHEQFDSDHRAIKFTMYLYGVKREAESVCKDMPWRKPSEALLKRMHACLPKMVKYKRRIGDERDIAVFVQNHTKEVQEALTRLSQGKESNRRTGCYWWNDEVSILHQKMIKARRRLSRYTHNNLRIEYNITRRAFREKVREVKIDSWKRFTSSIEDPWKGLVKILNRLNVNKAQSRTLCDESGGFANDLTDTLQMLGRQFYPEPLEYTREQKNIEEEVDKRLERIEGMEDITKCEFRTALKEMKKATAPGEDGITNQVLHILAHECGFENQYIKIFNACIQYGVFPDAWKKAKIVIIPKPSSLLDSVKSLRPISLTSVFSKLLERIVLARILHYIELSGNLALSQHAYRKGGSTTTALYEVSKFVQDAVKDKQVCVIVFLDISGAFDRTWHGGILSRLLQYGVPEYLVRWVKEFLANREAKFSTATEKHTVKLQQGCPQGGVLSPVLWNVLFNDMLVLKTRSSQDFHLKTVGYADDAAILCRARSVRNASVILTNYLVRIKEWAVRNRVQFNQAKLNVLTVNRNFSKPPAEVYYDHKLIREVSQYKYLGIVFDNRLTWRPHVKGLLEKLASVTRMLRGAVRESWGVRMSIMRMIFKTVFCPILLYGVAIWGWRFTGITLCAQFDKAIRKFCIMSTRCFRTTSNDVLFKFMKTVNFSMMMRQEVQRVVLLQLNLAHAEKDSLYSKDNWLHRTTPVSMDHFFYMCKQGLSQESRDIVYENLLDYYRVKPTQWISTNACVKERIQALWEGAKREGWVIFTNASVSSYGAGWAYNVFHHGFCVDTYYASVSRCTIFTAEAQAIRYAIQYAIQIKGLKRKENVEIRSDSLSVIKALEPSSIVDPMLKQVKEMLKIAEIQGVNIVLKWVPSHSGNEGNEMADRSAKKAVDSVISSTAMRVKRDLKPSIREHNNVIVKQQWEKVESNVPKLFFPQVSSFDSFLKSAPSTELCQLATGHCRLNEYLCKIGAVQSSMCACNEGVETVTHFLLVCPLHEDLRNEIWGDFQPTFEFISKDWRKVDEYIKGTKRFVVM